MFSSQRQRFLVSILHCSGVLYASKCYNSSKLPPPPKHEKHSPKERSKALLKEMLEKSNTTQPKGFEGFYKKQFVTNKPAGPMANETVRKALAPSSTEEMLLKKREAKHRKKRSKNVFYCFVLLGLGGSLYAGYDRIKTASLPPHGEGIQYHQILVNLVKHSAVYVDEERGPIGTRTFIDYKTLEESCDPSKDILVSFSTYYPFLPIIFLLAIPLLAFFNHSVNAIHKVPFSPVAATKKKFSFKRYDSVTTTLKDVAGHTEAKHELVEVIDFLKRPGRYSALGAKLPKGVLLDGPPGVGKTLLAKAVAGEAGVPFVSCSGSQFDEVYVGVGASRIRELFREAHECKPCVVFIDEIDSIGKSRKSLGGGGLPTTLNAFLSEVDGFKDSSGILLLGATNRADILDNAMTRSGRFDRKITLEKPPYKERVGIAHVHLKPLLLDSSSTPDAYAECIAALTPGCSGADIYSVCNEGAIHAARMGREKVTMDDFHKAAERVLIGMQKSAVEYQSIEKERLAFHEAGVVVSNWYQELTAPVIKTTILPCGASRSGVTQMLPQSTYISTEERLRQNIVGMLGGYAAEKYFFQDVSSRGVEKLREGTKMAHRMVCTYGMDPANFSHMALTQNPDAIEKPYGSKKEDSIDQSVEILLADCLSRAKKLLQERVVQVQAIAALLLKRETLSAHELWLILGDRPLMTKDFQAYLLS